MTLRRRAASARGKEPAAALARLHAHLADDHGRTCEATFSASSMSHIAQDDVGQACCEGVGALFGALFEIDCFHDELLLVVGGGG